MKIPTQQELWALFTYCSRTGRLHWNERPKMPKRWNTRFSGQAAGSVSPGSGHRKIRIDRISYLASRLVWGYHYGMPRRGLCVARIDGDTSNDRVENLRLSTYRELSPRTNECGHRGVSWDRRAKRFKAQAQYLGRRKHLGYYDTPQEAERAYLEFIENAD